MLPSRLQRVKPEERTLLREGAPAGPLLESLRAVIGAVARIESNVGEVLDTLRDKVLTAGLTRSEHHRGRLLTARVTVPDPWVRLTLRNGATAWNAQNPPAVRWADTWWECRDLVLVPAGYSLGYSTPLATLPGVVTGGNREIATVANDAFAEVSAFAPSAGAAGEIYLVTVTGQASPLAGGIFLSLNGVRFRGPSAPPDWTAPVDLPLPADFPGPVVDTVELVGARDVTNDGGAVTEATPGVSGARLAWTVVTLGTSRALRIRRIDGLTPGATYALTVWVAAK
jgi:hypothetical protein